MRYALLLLVWLGVSSAHAEEASAQVRAYNARIKVQAVDELQEAGIMTSMQAKAAREKMSAGYSPAELAEAQLPDSATAMELTWLQRAAGYVTFANAGIVISIILGVFCLIVVFGPWFFAMPKVVFEFLLTLSGVICIYKGGQHSPGGGEFVVLIGSLLLTGSLTVTFLSRNWRDAWKARGYGKKLSIETVYFALNTLHFGIVAAVYENTYIGFATIITLMATLGFSVMVMPGVTIVGFKSDNAVSRATASAFLILIGTVFLSESGLVPDSVFHQGALFMGTFVGYLGLLLCSSKWYIKKDKVNTYLIMQGVTLAAGIGALWAGSVFGIGTLQKMGGTFFCMWLVEKVLEVPSEDIFGHAFKGVVACSFFGAVFWFVRENADQYAQYFVF